MLSELDDIAWLLNLRGTDIPYNPLFFSYAVVYLHPEPAAEEEKKEAEGEGPLYDIVLYVDDQDTRFADEGVRAHLKESRIGTSLCVRVDSRKHSVFLCVAFNVRVIEWQSVQHLNLQLVDLVESCALCREWQTWKP